MHVQHIQDCVEEAEIRLQLEGRVDVDLSNVESDRNDVKTNSKILILVTRKTDPLGRRGKFEKEARRDVIRPTSVVVCILSIQLMFLYEYMCS